MTTTEREHHLVRIAMNYDTLIRAIRGEVRIIHDELPEDAEVVNVFHDGMANAIGVVLKHESFDAIPIGQTIPVLFGTRIEELGPRCEQLHTLLLLIDRLLTIEDFQSWTIEQRKRVLDYAWNLHLHASDNDDVLVPPMPPQVAKLPSPNERCVLPRTEITRIIGYLRMMANGAQPADPDALQQLIDQLAPES